MLVAVALLLLGSLGAELFISRSSLLVLLTGMILFLQGWEFLHAVSFPLAYLIFMIPIRVILYNQVTVPLQLLASRLATFGLELVQIPVLREGNILDPFKLLARERAWPLVSFRAALVSERG